MTKTSWISLLTDRRFYVITLLGIASGLPLALSASLLEARFTMAGMSLVSIGWVGIISLPYAFKFLWAPLLDRYTLPWLGRRRGWILTTQIVLCISIVALGLWEVEAHPFLIAAIAFIVAFCSASQDIAIDAYRTNILTAPEWGLGSSLASGSYRVGMLISGGFGFILADKLGWRDTYFILAACMLLGMVATCWAQNPPHELQDAPRSLKDSFILPFKAFFQREHAVALIVLLISYKFGDAFAAKMTTPFLLRGVGATMTEIGMINKLFGFAAVMFGMFFAGFCMLRMRLFTALWVFGLLQALSNLMFVWLALVGHDLPLMSATLMIENFTGGMGTAAFGALVMSLCDAKFTAFQFALFSSLVAIPREILGPITGYIAQYTDWPVFFMISFLVALPGLFLVRFLRGNIEAAQC